MRAYLPSRCLATARRGPLGAFDRGARYTPAEMGKFLSKEDLSAISAIELSRSASARKHGPITPAKDKGRTLYEGHGPLELPSAGSQDPCKI